MDLLFKLNDPCYEGDKLDLLFKLNDPLLAKPDESNENNYLLDTCEFNYIIDNCYLEKCVALKNF